MQTLALTLALLLGTGHEPTLPPKVELADFHGTEATAFEDFFGRTVLIEFFAHWCAPCARQVPHLNELQERYADRGLMVLGVTGDAPEDAEPWVAQHGMAFPYAYDPDLRLQIDLGFHPLPFALLVDPTGVVIWSGKADQLDEETLQRGLAGALAQPSWAWPESASMVRVELARRRYAAALTAAEAIDEAELRGDITALIDRLLEARARIAEAALQRNDLLTAHDIADELAPATEGLEIRKRFVSLLASVGREDDGLLGVQSELREVWRTVHAVSTRQAADELLDEIRAFSTAYPDTYVEAQAAGYEAALANLRMSLR